MGTTIGAPETGSIAESARDRLVVAAIDEFAAKGFHGTTTRDIANAAGLSPAGVYVHYKSKEELLYTIAVAGHEGVLAAMRSAASEVHHPTGQLVAIVRTFALWHADWHTRARVANSELLALSPAHFTKVNKLRRDITREMEAVVRAGVGDGSFDVTDPRMTANSLLSLGVDVSRWYTDSGHITPEQIADHHASLALRIVGVRPPSPPSGDSPAS